MKRAWQAAANGFAIAFCLVSGATLGLAADPGSPSKAEETFFETQVRPLLADNCYRCHGSSKQEAGLRLDSAERLLEGGDSGPAIVPGRPQDSLLIEAIRYESLEMPPDERLPDAAVTVLSRWIELGAFWPAGDVAPRGPTISAEDREFWSFQPISDPALPIATTANDSDPWCRNPIDRFVLRKMTEQGLVPAPVADGATLIRRVYFDLIGLPPPPDAVAAFTADASPLAYEQLIERLLNRPQYGEKWGRHWLDLVRYAESNGHGNDAFRPLAYRYRDYVVRAFNSDKPYDRFVAEQLAGDEIASNDPDALIATGFLRHWIYENNQRKVRQVREIILNDVTEITGEVFLAMGLGCARCHDHKFDPISRRDYYRLQAFFSGMLAREDVPLIDQQTLEERQPAQQRWEALTSDIRSRIAALEQPVRSKAVDRALRMFPQEIKDIYRKPRQQNSPLELQLVALVDRQLRDTQLNPQRRLKGVPKRRWEQLNAQLETLAAFRPPPVPYAMVVSEIGPIAPPTTLPGDRKRSEILPGFLSVLDERPAEIAPSADPASTGRRTALAEWIVSRENPLAARVIVNRIWQYYFGRGLVETSSDFGRLGSRPTHPELLDWLAQRFMDEGWSIKAISRLIVTSATYRQSARQSRQAVLQDPANQWLARRTIRRLDAEQFRDAALCVVGGLDITIGGPSVEAESPRRSIYLRVLRNSPDPLLRVFDAPDGFGSVAKREVTTTANQALFLMNGEWSLELAQRWARQLIEREPDPTARLDRMFRSAFGRPIETRQRRAIAQFLATHEDGVRAEYPGASQQDAETRAWSDLCHVLLNSNEFIYID